MEKGLVSNINWGGNALRGTTRYSTYSTLRGTLLFSYSAINSFFCASSKESVEQFPS